MASRLTPSDALFTRTQQRLLELLFAGGGEYSLNALIRRSGGGSGAIRREVERLLAAGIARERRAGNQRLIAAEPASPCYAPLMALSGPAAAAKPARRPLRPSAVLLARRGLVRKVLAAHGLSNPRVFGSVVRGTDSETSDLDLLVDARRNASLLDLAAAQRQLEEALGVRVDLVTLEDLPRKWREAVLTEAVPL
jgi:predicted nucleotidyltransferase